MLTVKGINFNLFSVTYLLNATKCELILVRITHDGTLNDHLQYINKEFHVCKVSGY